MKLAPAEAKAIKFVLVLIALSAFARWSRRPEPITVEQIKPARPVEAATISTPGGSPTRSQQGPIDPNRASLTELESLPGIGEVSARRIIAERPYQTLDDLARVIGRKRAYALARRLTLRAPTNSERQRASSADTGQQASPLDLNRATQAELERITGVGPALARRLLSARDSLGGFNNWAQVDSVAGIGPALLKKLKAAATL